MQQFAHLAVRIGDLNVPARLGCGLGHVLKDHTLHLELGQGVALMDVVPLGEWSTGRKRSRAAEGGTGNGSRVGGGGEIGKV